MSKLQITFEPNPARFILTGRIDATTANYFEDALNSELGNSGTSIVLECSGLEYISSMGLRVLLKLRKRKGERVILENVSPAVMSILSLTGFAELLEVAGGKE